MGDVLPLPQTTFAENEIVKVTQIFDTVSHVPFSDLSKINLTAKNTKLTPYDAINNIAISFAALAQQLKDWQEKYGV